MYFKYCLFFIIIFLNLNLLFGAGQSSDNFKIVADVYTFSSSPLAAGSSRVQCSSSLFQLSLASSVLQSSSYNIILGFQALSEGFDTDGDGIPDEYDYDCDGDGIYDHDDLYVYDTDNDMLNNIVMDDDDDNDFLLDYQEYQFGTSLILSDTDRDMQTDYEEWIAGTEGNNPGSFFCIEEIIREGNNILLRWEGRSGRTYVVEGKTNLLEEVWDVLWQTNVLENGDIIYRYDPSGRGIFRLRVSLY